MATPWPEVAAWPNDAREHATQNNCRNSTVHGMTNQSVKNAVEERRITTTLIQETNDIAKEMNDVTTAATYPSLLFAMAIGQGSKMRRNFCPSALPAISLTNCPHERLLKLCESPFTTTLYDLPPRTCLHEPASMTLSLREPPSFTARDHEDIDRAKATASERVAHAGGSVTLDVDGKAVEINIALIEDAAKVLVEIIEDDGLRMHILRVWEPYVSHWNPSDDAWMEPIPRWEEAAQDLNYWYQDDELQIESLQYRLNREMRLRTAEATKHAEELELSEQKADHAWCENGRMKAQICNLETELEAACQRLRMVRPQLDIARQTTQDAPELAEQWEVYCSSLDARGTQIEVGSGDSYGRLKKEIHDQIDRRAKLLSDFKDHGCRKSKLLRRLQDNRPKLKRLEEEQRNREGFLVLMEAQESRWSVDEPVVTPSYE
ncbi:uncharacterized protein PAC_15203 [Phialocephala subalpina]|uniref:Uncharacterized protein n=1 Tax=Phialocephala subalpina TaxID=576137 RepID=A0A1L7XJW7_9HELO|nr:uncharacterized protein PAC_15203 [Phialocephala subalpina]